MTLSTRLASEPTTIYSEHFLIERSVVHCQHARQPQSSCCSQRQLYRVPQLKGRPQQNHRCHSLTCACRSLQNLANIRISDSFKQNQTFRRCNNQNCPAVEETEQHRRDANLHVSPGGFPRRVYRLPEQRRRCLPPQRGRGLPQQRGRGLPQQRGRGLPQQRGQGLHQQRGRGLPHSSLNNHSGDCTCQALQRLRHIQKLDHLRQDQNVSQSHNQHFGVMEETDWHCPCCWSSSHEASPGGFLRKIYRVPQQTDESRPNFQRNGGIRYSTNPPFQSSVYDQKTHNFQPSHDCQTFTDANTCKDYKNGYWSSTEKHENFSRYPNNETFEQTPASESFPHFEQIPDYKNYRQYQPPQHFNQTPILLGFNQNCESRDFEQHQTSQLFQETSFLPNSDRTAFEQYEPSQIFEQAPTLEYSQENYQATDNKHYQTTQVFGQTSVLADCEQNQETTDFGQYKTSPMLEEPRVLTKCQQKVEPRNLEQYQTPEVSVHPPQFQLYSSLQPPVYEDLRQNYQYSTGQFAEPHVYSAATAVSNYIEAVFDQAETIPQDEERIEVCIDINCRFHNEYSTETYTFIPRSEQERVDEMANATILTKI